MQTSWVCLLYKEPQRSGERAELPGSPWPHWGSSKVSSIVSPKDRSPGCASGVWIFAQQYYLSNTPLAFFIHVVLKNNTKYDAAENLLKERSRRSTLPLPHFRDQHRSQFLLKVPLGRAPSLKVKCRSLINQSKCHLLMWHGKAEAEVPFAAPFHCDECAVWWWFSCL